MVVVISGRTGASSYTSISQDFADAGFDTILVDGNDFWIKGGAGNALLQAVIEMARQLAAAAEPPSLVLHEYEGAEHGFNMNTSHQRALVSDSRERAIARLREYLADH